MNRKKNQGFTLIEIAIVLVIIGLLLGGILKGQELITSARVRNLISQQDGVKAAFFGFQDRFRALPGDYTAATTNIVGVAATAFGVVLGRSSSDKRDEAYSLCPDPVMPCARAADASSLIRTAHDRAYQADAGFAVQSNASSAKHISPNPKDCIFLISTPPIRGRRPCTTSPLD